MRGRPCGWGDEGDVFRSNLLQRGRYVLGRYWRRIRMLDSLLCMSAGALESSFNSLGNHAWWGVSYSATFDLQLVS